MRFSSFASLPTLSLCYHPHPTEHLVFFSVFHRLILCRDAPSLRPSHVCFRLIFGRAFSSPSPNCFFFSFSFLSFLFFCLHKNNTLLPKIWIMVSKSKTTSQRKMNEKKYPKKKNPYIFIIIKSPLVVNPCVGLVCACDCVLAMAERLSGPRCACLSHSRSTAAQLIIPHASLSMAFYTFIPRMTLLPLIFIQLFARFWASFIVRARLRYLPLDEHITVALVLRVRARYAS